jgi:hypothetical protein
LFEPATNRLAGIDKLSTVTNTVTLAQEDETIG